MNAQSAFKRRIGMALVAVCATLLTSACATGQHAQTANEVPAIDATSGVVGSLQLHEVAIKPPTGATAHGSGDAVELQLVIVNTGHDDDTLSSLSTPAASGYQVFATTADASAAASASASDSASNTGSPSASSSASTSPSASASASVSLSPSPSSSAVPVPLTIAAGQTLSLSVTSADPVLLLRLNKTLFPGMSVQITFTFAKAGAVTLAVPIQLTNNSSPVGITLSPGGSSGAG